MKSTTQGAPASSFFKTHPRVCALVIAASKGSKLFPITSSDLPKHLLPIGGIPCILRLLDSLASFPQIVIALANGDTQTLPVLQQVATMRESETTQDKIWTFELNDRPKTITVIKLGEECFGPVEALRDVENEKLVHESTRLVVLPGDLVLLRKEINLEPLLRPAPDSACTAVLVDVGEVDEHGVPMRESTKAKKGALSRDEEDIEYIGLSHTPREACKGPSPLPRIVLKKSKLDVESDEDMTGSTAKLELPKARLRPGRLEIRTEWNDVHIYSIAPWVRQLMTLRKDLSSIQEDLLPLLVSRQFQGKQATFGKKLLEEMQNGEKPNVEVDEEPYSVLAMVLPGKTVVRAGTISSYHYACRETVANGSVLKMPAKSKWNGKFQSLVLEESTLGAKINMKASIVGKGCHLGAKCRLNNVIIMDNVTIGDNCSLQNTLIGPGAVLGNNCSLNDCQVGPGKEIPAGTKEKGESFMVGDAIAEDIL